MDLSFDRLRTLWLVSQLGTLVATSRELGVTPSAVSQQLTALEEEVGAELLQASGRGVALTPLGLALAEQGGQLVGGLEGVVAVAEAHLHNPTGSYKIGSIPTAALSIVRHALRSLRQSREGMDLSVIAQDAASSLKDLESHRVDLAVVDRFDSTSWVPAENVEVTSLGMETMQLFVPETLTLPGGPNDPVELEQLRDAAWILSPSFASYGEAVRRACHAAGFEPRVRWETDDIFLIQHYVADGLGVALHPPFPTVPAGVCVRPVAGPPIQRELLAVSRMSSLGRPIHQDVLQAMKAAALSESLKDS